MAIRSLEKKGFELWTPDHSINSRTVIGGAYRAVFGFWAGSKHGYVYPDWLVKGDVMPPLSEDEDSAWVNVPADKDVSVISECLQYKRVHKKAIILGAPHKELDKAADTFEDPQPAVAFRQGDGDPTIGVLPVEFGKWSLGVVALRLGKSDFETTMGYYSHEHQLLAPADGVRNLGISSTASVGGMQPRVPLA